MAPITQPNSHAESRRVASIRETRSPLRPASLALLTACLLLGPACKSTVEPTASNPGGVIATRLLHVDVRPVPLRPHPKYRTPDELLAALVSAIEHKSRDLYIATLSDPASGIGTREFRAVYDPVALKAWEQGSTRLAPDPWDLPLERGFTRFLFEIEPDSRYTFVLSPDPNSPVDEFDDRADTALVHRRYRLFSSPPNGSDPRCLGAGSCDLSLERAHGRWSVFRWIDHVDPSFGPNPGEAEASSFTGWRLESL